MRTSLNAFAPFGWVLCNDGLISNTGATAPATPAIARQNADTWPLFNLLWPLNGTIVYNNAGPTSKGGSAYADFVTNGLLLGLPLTLARTLLGLPPANNVTYAKSAPAWSTAVGTFAITGSTTLFYLGAPVYLTGTVPAGGPYTANTIYYVVVDPTQVDTTHIQLATTYARALAGTIITDTTSTTIGSGIIVNFALGAAFGENWHKQLGNELGTLLYIIQLPVISYILVAHPLCLILAEIQIYCKIPLLEITPRPVIRI